MLRRRFTAASALAALATSPPLHAQRGRVRVGYAGGYDPKVSPEARLRFETFLQEMARLGWQEGVNISYLFRFSDTSDEQCKAMAREFVAERVDLIVATYNQVAECSLEATRTVPIAAYTGDAIEFGYIRSLSAPGRNLTGVVEMAAALTAKRLQLLCQAVPRARRIAYLTARNGPVNAAHSAANKLGVTLTPVVVEKAEDLTRAISAARAADAWLVDEGGDPVDNPRQLPELIAATGKPAMYDAVGYVKAGGLMCYGYDRIEGTRELARFADRLLRGANPATLPAEQPTRYVFVFNARTARTLGYELPGSVRLQVTQVID